MNQTFSYARVSTVDQNLDTQLDILTKAGCERIFQDKITGMSLQRPALDELLGLLREGDTVLVARFFRLGRSRDHVIHLVNSFHQHGIHFKALGLGLSLAHDIIAQGHGGTLQVESQAGQGTTFSVALPLNGAAH